MWLYRTAPRRLVADHGPSEEPALVCARGGWARAPAEWITPRQGLAARVSVHLRHTERMRTAQGPRRDDPHAPAMTGTGLASCRSRTAEIDHARHPAALRARHRHPAPHPGRLPPRRGRW